MKLNVYFTPIGLKPQEIADRPVLVIDVLRTTTSIVAALAAGAKAVVPVETAEEGLRLAQNLEKDTVLLSGERKMERIPGFALGNSPLEMVAETVAGKTLVMATTNGTPAIVAAEPALPVLIGAVTNFSSAVEAARRQFEAASEISILCAGRERQFALEDAYLAGRFAQALLPGQQRRASELNDGAIAALELVRRYGDKWKRAISASTAAHDLKAAGFRADIVAATEADAHPFVPCYADRRVTLTEQA